MRRGRIITIGVVGLLALAAAGGYFYSVATKATAVTTAVATTQALTVTVSASGKVEADSEVGVYAPTAGTLSKVYVKDGDTVEAGDSLAVMATGPMKEEVAQAKAAQTAARAQLNAISRGVPTSIDWKAANAAVKAAESSLRTAHKNYHDYHEDYHDALTEEEKDAMKPTLRQLRSAEKQAYAALQAAKASKNQLSVAGQVQLDQAAAAQAVLTSTAAVKRAEDNLSKATLTAPSDGVVTFNGTVEKGSGVTPGVAPFTIVDLTKLAFTASVNEIDIAAVTKGQPATITLDSFLETGFPGKVSRVDTTATETATGGIAFPVRISFDPGESRLFVGMSGSAEIETLSIENALTVPIEAVLTEGTARTVFVMGTDGKAHETPVTVGASNDTVTQILSGLVAGDVVITSQLTALTDGQPVQSAKAL